jgi:hypothetical protein
MLLRTLLRTSSASVGLPLVVIFVLVALGDDLTSWVTDHYWPSATGSATFALAFISTGCAGLGAWEGARLHRGRVFSQTSVRSPLEITVPILAPIVITGLIGMLVALLLTANAAGISAGMPDLGVLIVEILLLTANTLGGFLIGRRWAAVISVPLTLVTAFIANAYPVSWDTMWPRHLVGGGLHNCCAVDQVLDTRAVWSAAVFGLALSLAAAYLIQAQASRSAIAAAVALVAVGTGAGAFLAQDLSADPVRARSTSSLDCKDEEAARLCLWPEVRQPGTVRSETQKVLARLGEAGVPFPSTFTMASQPQRDEAKLAILPNATAADIPSGVVAGLMPPPPACAADHDYPAGAAAESMAAWLLLTAGSAADTVRAQVPPEAFAVAQKVRHQPRQAQLAWYQGNVEAMSTCTKSPLLDVAKGAS